jgi:hypothetical protein
MYTPCLEAGLTGCLHYHLHFLLPCQKGSATPSPQLHTLGYFPRHRLASSRQLLDSQVDGHLLEEGSVSYIRGEGELSCEQQSIRKAHYNSVRCKRRDTRSRRSSRDRFWSVQQSSARFSRGRGAGLLAQKRSSSSNELSSTRIAVILFVPGR